MNNKQIRLLKLCKSKIRKPYCKISTALDASLDIELPVLRDRIGIIDEFEKVLFATARKVAEVE